MKNKILLISNSFWYFYNFRYDLIQTLLKNNYEIYLVAPYDKYINKFKNKGINCINWYVKSHSTNPLKELFTLVQLVKIIKSIDAKIVANFTIKASLYGTIACRFLKFKNIHNFFTGRGHIHINKDIFNKFLVKITNFIYYISLKETNIKCIFQNEQDMEYYIRKKIINSKNIYLIQGSGIDTDYFKNKREKEKSSKKYKTRLLFASRLTKEKGVEELIDAFDILSKKKINFELLLAGIIDKNNKSCISDEYIRKISKAKNLNYLGHVDNIKSLLDSIDILVLPSWREGFSRILLEAGSMETGLISYDVPGCNKIIQHLKTGLLVKPHDIKSLSLSIEKMINNDELRLKLGKNARTYIIKNYNCKKINNLIIEMFSKCK